MPWTGLKLWLYAPVAGQPAPVPFPPGEDVQLAIDIVADGSHSFSYGGDAWTQAGPHTYAIYFSFMVSFFTEVSIVDCVIRRTQQIFFLAIGRVGRLKNDHPPPRFKELPSMNTINGLGTMIAMPCSRLTSRH